MAFYEISSIRKGIIRNGVGRKAQRAKRKTQRASKKKNELNIQPAFFTLSQGDTLAKVLIEKGLLTEAEFMRMLSAERALYQDLW